MAPKKSFSQLLHALILTTVLTLLGGTTGIFALQQNATSLFITGKVVETTGGSPRQPVRVALVCGGQVVDEIYTAESGSFSFDLGRNQNSKWTDVSTARSNELEQSGHFNSSLDQDGMFVSNKFKTFNLNGCDVRLADGQGFQGANKITLGSRSSFDNPDVGMILLVRPDDKSGTAVSVTSLLAPDKAKEAFENAREALTRTKPDFKKAEKELEEAVKEYPEYSVAWELLGQVRLDRENPEGAREAFQQAVEHEPNYSQPYVALARLSLFSEQWAEAAELSQKAIEMGSPSAQALYFNGLANYYQGQMGASEKSLMLLKEREEIRNYPLAYFHLGAIHGQTGRIALAGDELRQYLALMPEEQVPPQQREFLEKQLTQWESQGLIPPAEK